MPSRYLCDVLEEMRKAVATQNYSYMLGLIEEAQSLGSRMEAGLMDLGTLERLRTERKELEKEIKVLKKKKSKKEKKLGIESKKDPYEY